MHGSKCQGRAFADFISGEDQPRLIEFLQSNSEGSVNSCSLKLLVPPSSTVSITLWHTCSLGLDGRRRHLVGLQEHQQDTSCAGVPLREELWQQNPVNRRLRMRRNRKGNAAPRTRTQRHQGMNPASEALESNEAVVMAEMADPEIVILDLSVNAQLLLGPSIGVGSRLARCVPHMTPFVSWIQEVLNHHMAGDSAEVLRLNHFTTALQTHDSPNPVPFSCSLAFVVNGVEADTTDDVRMPVCIVFKPVISSSSSSDGSSVIGGNGSSNHSCSRPTNGPCKSSRLGVGSRTGQSGQCDQPCSGALATGRRRCEL